MRLRRVDPNSLDGSVQVAHLRERLPSQMHGDRVVYESKKYVGGLSGPGFGYSQDAGMDLGHILEVVLDDAIAVGGRRDADG